MKRLILPSLFTALALSTACKPKPSAVPPGPEAAATPEAAAATPVVAATPVQNSNPPGNPGGPGGNFQQRAAERMQQMKTELGLTDDQAEKIRAIQEAQFGSLRQNMQSMSREDRRAAFQKARDAANAQITQILTPEQQPKWQAWQQEQQQRMQQRANGGNWGGGGGNRGPQ